MEDALDPVQRTADHREPAGRDAVGGQRLRPERGELWHHGVLPVQVVAAVDAVERVRQRRQQ